MEQLEVARESIWEYPRRPKAERSIRHVVVAFNGAEIAASHRCIRVVEHGRPPVYYVPREDVRTDLLRPSARRTWCACRGVAHYFSIEVEGQVALDAAWSYAQPVPSLREIKDHIAFYPDRVDACFLDGERVRSIKGSYFGGWITNELDGPFGIEPRTEDVEL